MNYPVFFAPDSISANQKFCISVPVPEDLFFTNQAVQLVDDENKPISCVIKAKHLWPNQSIKWFHLNGVFNRKVERDERFFLSKVTKVSFEKISSWVVEDGVAKTIELITHVNKICVPKHTFLGLSINDEVSSKFSLTIDKSESTVDDVKTSYMVNYDANLKPFSCVITQTASARDLNKNLPLSLHAVLEVFYIDGHVNFEFSILNPNPLVHKDGQWDLGNPNSVFIRKCLIEFDYIGNSLDVSLDEQNNLNKIDHLQVVQHSSGGENWYSDNHKNSENIVPLTRKGASYTYTRKEELNEAEIERPSPQITCDLGHQKLQIRTHHFWQKFPSSLVVAKNKTKIDFVGSESKVDVELQPGEKKSSNLSFILSKSQRTNTCLEPAEIAIDMKALEASKNIYLFSSSLLKHPLQFLLSEAENGAAKWIDKREKLDEYGWRNFGDLYADHEAIGHKGSNIFVSHYNNQYDPLMGFIKQWLLTANPEYKKLADDLFDHIVNIDIYHCQKDKPEYNKGLFWHTDHYVAAETATHRTYSKRQPSDVYIDHAGGGGPGTHHCYSTGLCYYYLLTGKSSAHDAVIGMAEWMQNLFEGDGTLLGLIIRIKNANYLKIPFTNKLLLGFGNGGVRNVFTNSYPLDRGTGNYVNTLLDAYEISRKQDYINLAEYVILNTIDYTDNIAKRNFEDIEETWFYAVFLQSVARFLVASLIYKHSSPYLNRIVKSFLHYLYWIVENETYYLARKEVLEFPNDTWTGQDLRKIQLLHFAYCLTEDERFIDKAKELEGFVYKQLISSEESTLTRIQALIMQNYSDIESISNIVDIKSFKLDPNEKSKSKLNDNITLRAMRFIKNYSLSKEITLLKIRLPFLNKANKK